MMWSPVCRGAPAWTYRFTRRTSANSTPSTTATAILAKRQVIPNSARTPATSGAPRRAAESGASGAALGAVAGAGAVVGWVASAGAVAGGTVAARSAAVVVGTGDRAASGVIPECNATISARMSNAGCWTRDGHIREVYCTLHTAVVAA